MHISTELRINLLGTATVALADQPERQPRLAKVMALLAYLVVERTPHSRSSLATLLWPERSEQDARRNLSQTVTRIRKLIGDTGKQSAYFDISRSAIGCRADAPIYCDADEYFGRLGEVARHAHDSLAACAACRKRLTEAIALVKGEWMSGFAVGDAAPFDEWLLLQREHLHETQLRALFELAEVGLERGDWALTQAMARRQIQHEPWREKAHYQLINALARDGQREAAIAQFERCEAVLREEMGIGVSAETETLHNLIQSGTLTTLATVPDNPGSTHSAASLPASATPFIGREVELSTLLDMLANDEYRVTTIVGQGGIGKTRLALEAGRQISSQADFESVYFVPLRGIDSPDMIPSAIASALDLTLSLNKTIAAQVIKYLQSRRILLILDNYEHLLGDVSWLLDLLTQTQQLHLLVTSRAQLRLMAEGLLHLSGLPVPKSDMPLTQVQQFASVRLFLDRVRRQNRRFQPTPNDWAHIMRICQLLEGWPLGIELAAVWAQEMSVAEIADGIAQDASFLETDLRDVPDHHRSLQAVFSQSWQRLSISEQRVLVRLSVMRGTFSKQAAQAVAESTPLILRRLIHRSLLRRVGVQQFDMHEMIRQFVGAKLVAERDSAEIAHATYYLKQIALYETAKSNQIIALSSTLRESLSNIYAAWDHAAETLNIALLSLSIHGVKEYHSHHILIEMGIKLHIRLIEQLEQQPMTNAGRSLLGWAMLYMGGLWSDINRADQALPFLGRAEQFIHAESSPEFIAHCSYQRGRVLLHRGANAEALPIFERGLSYAERGTDQMIHALLLREVGSVYRQRSDYLTLINYLQRALEIYRSLGDVLNEQRMLAWLGAYRADVGHYWQGRELLLRSQQLGGRQEGLYAWLSAESGIALIDNQLGDPMGAIKRHLPAIATMRQHGFKWRTAMALKDLSLAQIALKQHEEAAASLAEARAIAQQHDLTEVLYHNALASAFQSMHAASYASAAAQFDASVQQMTTLERTVGVIESRINAAYCRLQLGQLPDASIDDVLTQVATKRLDGALQREWLYFAAWHLAVALSLESADTIRHASEQFIALVAAGINDPVAHAAYLQQQVTFS